MNGRFTKILLAGIFGAIAVFILIIFIMPESKRPFPFSVNSGRTDLTPGRVIIPQAISYFPDDDNRAEQIARMELMTLRVPLEEGEILISLLSDDYDGDHHEEQIIAYRNLLEAESPIYVAYIVFDTQRREYRRVWSSPTVATRPGTLSLYTLDMIGDRGLCILLSGMTGNEQTLTVFRQMPAADVIAGAPMFLKVSEIKMDGSIVVREAERSQAYQLGLAKGQSHSISAFGRDNNSSNVMDQIEILYAFNETSGIYEQSRVTAIPGIQIEQRRVRELLGNTRAFEEFITGLWYSVSPQGTLDNRRFIYFDPQSREIIFYEEDTQQVFSWQNSNATRYGLYVSSQNISVSTLRRSIDIELESLESIKIKVFEDVRLRLGVSAPWDGSYRKTGSPEQRTVVNNVNSFIDAAYDGPMGKIRFHPDGDFEITSAGTVRQGKYAFFYMDNDELLELRSIENPDTSARTTTRETYLIESTVLNTEAAENDPYRLITLSRVLLGARGIQRLHEGTITLSLSE